MNVKWITLGIGLVASVSQAAVLVQTDFSGGTTVTPKLTTPDNGTDPHSYGTVVNVGGTAVDSLGIWPSVLSRSEYLGGTAWATSAVIRRISRRGAPA